MKAQQHAWRFAKLLFAALVFALGVIACGGGGSSGGGGTTDNTPPNGYQLAVKSVNLDAIGGQPSGAGTRVAQSAFIIAADANLMLSVTVENIGNEPSPANTSFVLYRSDDDAKLETSDTVIGTYQVGAVPAGGEKVITRDISTPTLSTDANNPTNFIVAGEFEDYEVEDDFRGVEVYSTDGIAINNGATIGGGKIVDGIKYDWSASGAAVSKASVLTGETITISVKVTNNGFRAPSASLRFYRSDDAFIRSDDTRVGTVSVRALATGANSNEFVRVTVPSAADTYYYGACVVGAGDSTSSNDCSRGVQVVVAAPAVPVFDLSVTAFSVSKSSVVAGEAITLNATVGNDSSATASSSVATLRYYRSSDVTITSADTEVGAADSIGALAAAATSPQTATDSPSIAGTYYYGACIVATGDSDTSNNCSVGRQVVVTAPVPAAFDLSVTAFSVDPSSIVAGAEITFAATVSNASSATVSSPIAELKYYRSSDATIDATDTEVGAADAIGVLAAAAMESETATDSPSTAGTVYYGACVVATGDSDTTNNCSAGSRVDVAAQAFDLSVSTFGVSKSSVVTDEAITLSATVTNASSATVSSPVATLRYYRSIDSTIDSTNDTEVGTSDSISALAAAATSDQTATVNPSTAGTVYYGACIVGAGDSNANNNCSVGVQVVVAEPAPPAAFDLSVTAFSASDLSPVTGDTITLNATVTNASSATGSSPVAELKYYRSTDMTIDSTDTVVGTAASISALTAGGTESETASVTVPSSVGIVYYGACVVGAGDSNSGNNCSASVRVDVAAQMFDLSVSTFTATPSFALTGDTITLNATVTNAASATVSSPVATLKYYRSTDATISAIDIEVGVADSISALAAAATESETATDSPSAADTYYYGACIVATGDSDTTNNCSAGVQVDVAAREFDLSVTTFSVSESSIVAGEAITFSATVANDSSATVSSPVAELKYYRSAYSTITSTDTEVGVADSIGALAAAATESETAIVNPSTAGTFYYGACIVATGDSDSSNNCSVGVQVDVVAAVFELSVPAFSASHSSVHTGDPITFSATVTNASSATISSPAALLTYYYSVRDRYGYIHPGLSVAVTDSVGPLAPGATSEKTAIFIAPSFVGTYTFLGCVGLVGAEYATCSDRDAKVVISGLYDVSITTFSVDDIPSAGAFVVGDNITLRATVANDATATRVSPLGKLNYYRSDDATISDADTNISTVSSDTVVRLLSPGETEAHYASYSPSTVGTYYYGTLHLYIQRHWRRKRHKQQLFGGCAGGCCRSSF